MKKVVYFVIFIALISCLDRHGKKADMASNLDLELKEKSGLNINSKLLTRITSEIKKEPIKLNREVYNYDEEGEETHYFLDKGLVFKFVNDDKAHSVFNKYYDEVIKGGNYIFLTNMDFDESYNTFYDVVIIDGSDPFKLIKKIGTNGVNYDVYNAGIVKQLEEWNAQVDFRFVVIDVARIHAYMGKLPNNLKHFSEEVYEFCPDVIDQGYSSMDEMILDYKTNKYFWLWWD